MTINIAHRGFSGKYPENTMLSFRKALELGVDAIELDVQLSKDGEVMIFHDEDLMRVTGENGLLMERTCSELQSLDASGSFRYKYGINFIPTLTEYLEFTENIEILTFLELKNSMIPYPHLEEKVKDVIYRYGQQKKIILFSANHPSVIHFGRLAPDVRILFPFDNWIYDYGAYCQKHGVSACMPYFHALTPEVVTEIKAHEVAIYPWIIDEPSDMVALLSLGVDGILTNFPDRLKVFLQGKENL
ncbi:MAG: hypothetical protein CVU46_03035 [Chloroflexi bacterium HGW-Chloroflexi-8]|nr:MAG: hypothetical protein CVU46_03035 [Chloroflexi bacterium HGW-Chloroflexi-8]